MLLIISLILIFLLALTASPSYPVIMIIITHISGTNIIIFIITAATTAIAKVQPQMQSSPSSLYHIILPYHVFTPPLISLPPPPTHTPPPLPPSIDNPPSPTHPPPSILLITTSSATPATGSYSSENAIRTLTGGAN